MGNSTRVLEETSATLLWATLLILVVFATGAIVILWVDRWRKRASAARLTPSDELAHFRVLYEQGELSREEFERIRARLSRRLRNELEVPPKAGAPPAEAAQPTAPLTGIRSAESMTEIQPAGADGPPPVPPPTAGPDSPAP
jgi:hypothetical protein